MKIAKSILLGEHVDATQVDYEDVHGFQIVCPCCAESVIKVVRPLADGRDTQFFSHRQAGPDGPAECEIRVSSISREERASLDREARGQRIDAFRAVFHGALALDMQSRGVEHPRKASAKLRQSGLYEILYRSFREQILEDHEFMKTMDDDEVIKQLRGISDRQDREQKVPFPGRVKRRCASDMTDHLLTTQGDANLRHLFDCVIIVTAKEENHRRQQSKRLPPGFDRANYLSDVVWHPNKMKAIQQLNSLKIFDVDRTTNDKLAGIANIFMGKAREIVAEFPYFEVLENHRGGHPPHRGLRAMYEGRDKRRVKFDADKILAMIEEYRTIAAEQTAAPVP